MNTQTKTTASRGYFFALLSAGILSLTAIFIRHLSVEYQLPSLILAVWRDVFVVSVLFPALLIINRKLVRVQKKHIPFLIFYGLVLASFNASWTLSVAYTGAAVATVLCYCSGAFTVLLGWWLLKEPISWTKIIVVIITLGGCVLVSGALDVQASDISWPGIIAGVISGLCYAVYSLMGRKASHSGLDPWTTLLYTFGFAAIILFIINVLPLSFIPQTASSFSDFFWLKDAWLGWFILFLLGAGPTVLGFGTYNVALTYLDSSLVNLIVTIEPPFTVAIAYILLGERLTTVQIIGGVMILGGVLILRLFEKSGRQEPTGSQSASPAD